MVYCQGERMKTQSITKTVTYVNVKILISNAKYNKTVIINNINFFSVIIYKIY